MVRLLVFLVPLFWLVSAQAQTPVIVCDPLNGATPTVDGAIGAGEWPATPNYLLRAPDYPLDTNFTCVYDAQNLYILVDAVEDTTDADIDECLLVFDLPPTHKIVEIWRQAGVQRRFTGGASGQSAIGFAGNRVYEFVIALDSIGLLPGGSIPFYSPVQYKEPGVWASMPYDGGTGTDNVFPVGLVLTPGYPPTITSVSGYARLALATQAASAPALSNAGMFVLVLLLAGLAFRVLRRRRPGCA
jgi:hypothetical protein